MKLHKISNLLYLGEADDRMMMDVDDMIQKGMGSVLDFRLHLPPDYIKRERMDLMKIHAQYTQLPMDQDCDGPMMLLESACREMMYDLSAGNRVTLMENKDQHCAMMVATMGMMKMGFSPKHSVEMIEASGKTTDLTDRQKKLLNLYGEYLVQKPFLKDEMEDFMAKQKMMDEMNKEDPSMMKMSESSLGFLSARVKEAEKSQPIRKGCGCSH